jgi:hypothetical protein
MVDPLPAESKSKVTRGKSNPKPSSSPQAIPEVVIETTGQAEKVAKELRDKLVGMIDAAALMRANRRRATAIDRVDFEAAFDDVVNPSPRPKRLALIGDVCGIFGAGFIGYSINVYTGPETAHRVGHVAILAGLVLSVAGACLKYVDPSR